MSRYIGSPAPIWVVSVVRRPGRDPSPRAALPGVSMPFEGDGSELFVTLNQSAEGKERLAIVLSSAPATASGITRVLRTVALR
ncbi:hypothetical protein JANAI62_05880 [Jannaschia pagri]|uniref:Uncharacterized protein n=1 Tax=Jannaschia pagri TaxID=2829797 RepID=A0ABQ4NHS8_9RHOB|nr:hypothetical protein JANAI61_03860 [Jannaschia sp. AI_61]GIT93965.1 hypothetical protein JANAI62_05880 [Jannaschia sp. AI_62]